VTKQLWAAGVILAGLALALGVPRRSNTNRNDARLPEIRRAAEQIGSLHTKKQPPSPGDWLAEHKETGQTFDEYRAAEPNIPTKDHTTLYLQPIGTFDEFQGQLLQDTGELLSRFYSVPLKVLDPLGSDTIPKEARRMHPTWGDRQILTTYVLDQVLKPRRPADAVAMLALTASDLWPGENWNFVFGQASLKDRVGVWSLYRYGPTNDEEQRAQFRRRLCKVAVHETGHMFGIAHCTAYECGMNGSNHLAEMDASPLWFCLADEQKVWWACGCDPGSRYRSLADFAVTHHLQEEAEFWKASLERLGRN
jgi:archaemetzincin